MENQATTQLELFSTAAGASTQKRRLNNFSLSRLRNYEKALFVIIGIIITSVISFSLGVEKGKRLSALNNNMRLDLARAALTPKLQAKETIAELKVIAPARQEAAINKIDPLKGYTIQLASYKNQSSAQKEALNLKKRGLAAFILTRGGYAVLCVGNFPNREAARTQLSELQKQYQGCYIRRL